MDAAAFDPGDDGDPYLVFDAIRSEVLRHGAKRVIIDNITWLRDDQQKSGTAAVLMKQLHGLSRETEASILVLAHTPKRPDDRPLSLNDLAGSRFLASFSDAVFGIGKDLRNPSRRYLKQLKVRSGDFDHPEVSA